MFFCMSWCQYPNKFQVTITWNSHILGKTVSLLLTSPGRLNSLDCLVSVLGRFALLGPKTWHHNLKKERFTLARGSRFQSMVGWLLGRNVMAGQLSRWWILGSREGVQCQREMYPPRAHPGPTSFRAPPAGNALGCDQVTQVSVTSPAKLSSLNGTVLSYLNHNSHSDSVESSCKHTMAWKIRGLQEQYPMCGKYTNGCLLNIFCGTGCKLETFYISMGLVLVLYHVSEARNMSFFFFQFFCIIWADLTDT